MEPIATHPVRFFCIDAKIRTQNALLPISILNTKIPSKMVCSSCTFYSPVQSTFLSDPVRIIFQNRIVFNMSIFAQRATHTQTTHATFAPCTITNNPTRSDRVLNFSLSYKHDSQIL